MCGDGKRNVMWKEWKVQPMGSMVLQSLADRRDLLLSRLVVSLGGAPPGPSPLQHLRCHC